MYFDCKNFRINHSVDLSSFFFFFCFLSLFLISSFSFFPFLFLFFDFLLSSCFLSYFFLFFFFFFPYFFLFPKFSSFLLFFSFLIFFFLFFVFFTFFAFLYLVYYYAFFMLLCSLPNSLRVKRTVEQLLVFTGCSSIKFFNSSLFSEHSELGYLQYPIRTFITHCAVPAWLTGGHDAALLTKYFSPNHYIGKQRISLGVTSILNRKMCFCPHT